MKYVTFSYDDAVVEDVLLVELFNKYKIIGTFNINTGLFNDNNRLNKNEVINLYKNHEVCAHSLTHPDLTKLTEIELIKEVKDDIENIEKIFDCKCVGLAYPFGTTNSKVKKIIKELGIKHARTVVDTLDVTLPNDLLELPQTCHHNHPKLKEIIENFISLDDDNNYLLSIWGHSYDFNDPNQINLKQFEEYLKILTSNKNIQFLGMTDTFIKLNILGE